MLNHAVANLSASADSGELREVVAIAMAIEGTRRSQGRGTWASRKAPGNHTVQPTCNAATGGDHIEYDRIEVYCSGCNYHRESCHGLAWWTKNGRGHSLRIRTGLLVDKGKPCPPVLGQVGTEPLRIGDGGWRQGFESRRSDLVKEVRSTMGQQYLPTPELCSCRRPPTWDTSPRPRMRTSTETTSDSRDDEAPERFTPDWTPRQVRALIEPNL